MHLTVPEDRREQVIAELWEFNTAGVTEENGGLRAFFDSSVNIVAIESAFKAFRPVVIEEEEHDWVKESQDSWQPMEVGEKWFLVPEWRDDSPPPGRRRLTIYPGLACGTGWHATTRLCLQAMERHVTEGSRVLDVGTGSGILAHAAHLLGASRVAGCDIEHSAIEVAAGNGLRAGIAVDLFTGSLRSVRANAFDVIVANLNAATITQLTSEFRRLRGTLILAGFREDEVDRVCRAIAAAPAAVFEEDGWGCVVIAG